MPLFISAIRRANDLAMALEARCYHGGAGRTKMKPLIYAGRDYLAYGIILIYVLIWYNPSGSKTLSQIFQFNGGNIFFPTEPANHCGESAFG